MAKISRLLFPLALLACAAAAAAAAEPLTCRVIDVEDAATFRVLCDGRRALLRLPGLRPPKTGPPHLGGEPFAAESRERAAHWLTGKVIAVGQPHSDSQRVRVLLQGGDLSVAILEHGLAYLSRDGGRELEPALVAAEREARAAGRGVWSHAAWRAHQASVNRPVVLPRLPRTPPPPSLAEQARRLTDKSWEERKAAFEAALERLEGEEPDPD